MHDTLLEHTGVVSMASYLTGWHQRVCAEPDWISQFKLRMNMCSCHS